MMIAHWAVPRSALVSCRRVKRPLIPRYARCFMLLRPHSLSDY
jgi:hypothetical protein